MRGVMPKQKESRGVPTDTRKQKRGEEDTVHKILMKVWHQQTSTSSEALGESSMELYSVSGESSDDKWVMVQRARKGKKKDHKTKKFKKWNL